MWTSGRRLASGMRGLQRIVTLLKVEAGRSAALRKPVGARMLCDLIVRPGYFRWSLDL